eukprot:4669526-Lingulodinium_polyedra.AAC.1
MCEWSISNADSQPVRVVVRDMRPDIDHRLVFASVQQWECLARVLVQHRWGVVVVSASRRGGQ